MYDINRLLLIKKFSKAIICGGGHIFKVTYKRQKINYLRILDANPERKFSYHNELVSTLATPEKWPKVFKKLDLLILHFVW